MTGTLNLPVKAAVAPGDEEAPASLDDAINTASSGAVINLGSGVYEVTPTTLNKNITIKGIEGTKIVTNGVAFKLSGSAELTVSNVTFETTAADAMIVRNAAQTDTGKIILDGCTFEGGRFGVYFDGLTGGSITNCTFNNTAKAAIGLGNALAGDVTISGNTYNVADDAVAIEYEAEVEDHIKGTDLATLPEDLISKN